MKIISIKSLGPQQTYSPEMQSDQHNYMTANSDAIHRNSHSVSYCLVAYICLWLKANFAHEWWATVMTTCNPEKLIRYMNVARTEGVQFKSVDISNLTTYFNTFVTKRSHHDDGESAGYIVPGLPGMKGIGKKVCEKFAKTGQYESIDDFVMQRGRHKILMERLIKLGAFKHLPGHNNTRAVWMYYQYTYCDSGHEIKKFQSDIRTILAERDGWSEDAIIKERIRQEDEYRAIYPKRKTVPKKITAWMPNLTASLATMNDIYKEDYKLSDVLKFEEQFLGYTLHSPVELFLTRGSRTIEKAKECGELEVVITDILFAKTKNDTPMCRLTVTDGLMSGTLIIWNDQLVSLDKLILKKGVGIRVMVSYSKEFNSFSARRNCAIIKLNRRENVG